MGKDTLISWTDHTFNPWIGCAKVSPGCKHCYAEEWARRFSREFAERKRTSPANWKEPLKWNKVAAAHGVQLRVFCASLADWLDDKVPIQWLADLLKLICDTPNLDWQLLTKRPENALERVNAAMDLFDPQQKLWTLGGLVPHNVWIGASVENQAMADKRIPQLLKIPAKIHFLSCEPLLEQVDLSSDAIEAEMRLAHPEAQIDWVIAGGESGRQARECDVDWIRSIVKQCEAAKVPVFVKQLGSEPYWNTTTHEVYSGRRKVLSHPKGGDPAEWPEALRVQQFPKP